MPRDKEFQRKKKDTRMPVRDSHAEERIDARQSEQDFNLLRARDAPSSTGTARSRRYETAAQQAADDTQPPQRMYRRRTLLRWNIWLEKIWTMSLLHRNRAGGISDMKIPGVRILIVAILV